MGGGYILFVIFNALAIGLYQNAICISLGLCGVFIVVDLVNGKSAKKILSEFFIQAICIVISLVFYYAFYYFTLKFFGVNKDSGAYNSSDKIQFFGIKRTIKLVIKTYILFFRNLILCSDYRVEGVFKQFYSAHEIFTLIGFFIALYFIFAYLIRIFKLKKISVKRLVLVLFVMALLPFAFACICVVANGLGVPNLYLQDYLIIALPFILIKSYKNYGDDTIYEKKDLLVSLIISIILILGIVLLYLTKLKGNQAIKTFIYQLLIFIVVGILYVVKRKINKIKILRTALVIFIGIGIMFNGISYANGESTKIYLAEQKRLSLSGVMVQTIESIDGIGDSPKIYFYGGTDVFDEEIPNFYASYLNVMFNKNYSCVNESVELTDLQKEEINSLNVFPSENCAKIIDGILVVKLSEKN